MSVKEAFDVYFERLNTYNKKTGGCFSKTVYLKERDIGGIYIEGSIDDEGYAKWRPIMQKSKFNYSKLESEFGFIINEQLKQFFNTYYFFSLSGKINNWTCSLNCILPNVELELLIKESRKHGNPEYMESPCFYIGDAESEEYGYGALYCNNDNGSIIVIDWDSAYDCDFERPISEFTYIVSNSLEDFLSNLEADY